MTSGAATDHQVVVTAGHVDHGKSALVRALTGTDPDRYAEEKRRGMTLDLGFAVTRLPSGRSLSLVDVPGHERFVPTMLAGAGPVLAAVVVVAADEGWMPQTEEHVAVIDALGGRHALLVVTKSDLADPSTARADALERLARTALGRVEDVAVSTRTGAGVEDLHRALDRLADQLPPADPDRPVRLWVDRSFTIRGAGTVVTGTLAAGRLKVGDRLVLRPGHEVTVRGLQSHSQSQDVVEPVTRVAVNLRGIAAEDVGRGDALVTPGRWAWSHLLDGTVPDTDALPRQVVAHLGSSGVPAVVRVLADGAVRVRLSRALPCHVGDRVLLRDPSRHTVLQAMTVVDVAPPALDRRGAAAARAHALAGPLTATAEVARRGLATATDLRSAGYEDAPEGGVRAGDVYVSTAQWQQWQEALQQALSTSPEDLPAEDLRQRAGIPRGDLLAALLAEDSQWDLAAGRVSRRDGGRELSASLATLVDRLRLDPLDAPGADELAALDLDRAELAAAVRTDAVLSLGHGVYVGPTAPDLAVARLAALPAQFTTSEARQAMRVSRRVAIPLLEHLDLTRRTVRVDETHRRLRTPPV